MSADCVILPFRRVDAISLPQHVVAVSNERTLDELVTELRLAGAVDSDEIAAVLEAAGINDTIAAESYGYADVFAMADALVIHTRAEGTDRGTSDGHGGMPVGETLLRGLTFVVPGLTAAGLPALGATFRDQLIVMVAVVAGWALGQALAARGYLRMAIDDLAARRSTAAAAGLIGLVASGLAALAVILWGVSPAVGGVAAAQVIYAVSATTALVFGGARWVLAALVPAAATAIAVAVADPPARVVAGGFTLSVLLVCTAALTRIWPALHPQIFARTARSNVGVAQKSGEMAAVLRYGGYGAAVATLLMTGLAVWAVAIRPAHRVDPVVLALVLSVIAIEWEVVWLLTRGRSTLRAATTRLALTLTGWLLLGAAVFRYLAVTAVLAAVAMTVLPRNSTDLIGWHLGWVLALGVAFLAGGVLVTHHGLAAAAALAGSVAALALLTLALPVSPDDRARAGTLLAAGLAVALVLTAGRRLSRPEAYR